MRSCSTECRENQALCISLPASPSRSSEVDLQGKGRWVKQGLLLLCSTGSASQGAAAVPCLPSQPPPAARRRARCRSLRGYAPVRSWLFSPSFSFLYCLPLLFCFISSHSQKISRQTLPPKTMWSSMCYCFGWVHAFYIHFKGGMSIKPTSFIQPDFQSSQKHSTVFG